MSTRPSRPSGNGKRTTPTKKRLTAPEAAIDTTPAPQPPPPTSASSMVSSRVAMTEKSLIKAKAAFANFSLSRFPKGETPSTHVAPGQSAAEHQRNAISKQLANAPLNGSMSFALTPSALKSLLPSYDPHKGTVSLDEVISVLESNMRGNEFYSRGNPTLNRLAVQSQASDIMASIMGGTKK